MFYKTVYNLEGHTPLWPLIINKYLALFIHKYVRGRNQPSSSLLRYYGRQAPCVPPEESTF